MLKLDLTEIKGQFRYLIQFNWMFGFYQLETKPITNMILSEGIGLVIDKLLDSVQGIAIGTGTTEPTLADTALEAETTRVVATATEYPTYVEFKSIFYSSDLNGTTEVGLVTDLTPPGILVTRATCPAITIPENLSLAIIYPIGFIPSENTVGWALTSGQTYTFEKERVNEIVGVHERDTNTGYTPVTSIALVESTPSSYWHDTSTGTLYIHCSDGGDPDTTTGRQILVMSGV